MIVFQLTVIKVKKNIGVIHIDGARIFDWGGRAKPQIIGNDVIKNFRKEKFLWDKDTVEWRIRSRDLGWHKA